MLRCKGEDRAYNPRRKAADFQKVSRGIAK